MCGHLRVVAGLSLSFGFRQKALLVVEIELCQVVVRVSAPRTTRENSVDYQIRVKCWHRMPFWWMNIGTPLCNRVQVPYDDLSWLGRNRGVKMTKKSKKSKKWLYAINHPLYIFKNCPLVRGHDLPSAPYFRPQNLASPRSTNQFSLRRLFEKSTPRYLGDSGLRKSPSNFSSWKSDFRP